MAYQIVYDPATPGTIQINNNNSGGELYPYKQGGLFPSWDDRDQRMGLTTVPGNNIPVLAMVPYYAIEISSTGSGGLAAAASYADLIDFVNAYCYLGATAVISGSVTIGASEAHIGEVGTSSTIVTLIPTLLLTPYATNDVLGTKAALANALRIADGTCTLTNVEVIDNDNIKAPIDLLIYSAEPTSGTYTNQVAFVWNNTDMLKNIGCVSITAGMYTTFGNGARATTGLIGNVLKGTGGNTSLWAIPVVRGAASYTAASSITIKLGFYRN